MDTGRSVDKHPMRDFLPYIVIHNTLSICSRIAGWETRDPRRGLKLSHLVSSHMVLIRQADLDESQATDAHQYWAD